MRVVVLGAGKVGSLIALELSRRYEVAVADRSAESLKPLEPYTKTLVADLGSWDKLLETVRSYEVVVDALPGGLGYRVLKACAEARRDVVDVSFMPEDAFSLRDSVEDAGITAAVDAGFAPGLSNILVGRIQKELGPLKRVEVSVGGLPKEPRPPLYHAVLFSPEDLIDEYLRPARVVRGGRIVSVDPLSTVERVRVMGLELERFPTDGLRTMLYTISAEEMTEYTLRWPGHLERMRVLKELGFFDKENLGWTLRVVLPHMAYETEDVSVMEVVGETEESRVRFTLYDEAVGKHTSMARVTGYTAALVADLLIRGRLPKGLVPPETLGSDAGAFDYIVGGLRSKGVRLERLE